MCIRDRVRFARMSAKQAAAGVALATVGLYVPYSIVRWPGGDVFAIHLAIYLLASLACGMLLNTRAGGKSLHWGPAIISGFFVVIAVLGAVFVSVAERGLTPVSYTHLDVYKRQALGAGGYQRLFYHRGRIGRGVCFGRRTRSDLMAWALAIARNRQSP